MKKSYQKRLDTVENELEDGCAEIPDLDSILELPSLIREVAFVQAVCDRHRKSKKKRSKADTVSLETMIESNLQSTENKN